MTATQGVLVHLVDTQAHHLYELFPETLTFRHTLVDDPQQLERLADASLHPLILPALLRGSPAQYMGHPLPFQAADFPGLRHATLLPGDGTPDALGALYSQHIALANHPSLRLLARGLTPYELARDRWSKRTDFEYAWSLIKSTVPLASCFDVKSGEDALSCALDGIPGLGAAVRIASKSLKAGQRLIAAGALLRTTTYRDVARLNSAWAASRPASQATPPYPGLRRWASAPQLSPDSMTWVDGHLQPVRHGTPARLLDDSGQQAYGPALEQLESATGGWVSTLPVARPGLAPGAFVIVPDAYDAPTVAVQGLPSPRRVFRGEGVVDLMVDGRP
ncbi:hypothetical protein [Pseudomonas sp. KNUC1026]|uniref:hypothetical protein n=1 Tax=Pseudomonas sp. KNUC1026 TaxID=2893890 RepID=UPI001F22F45C|nr:hypothetical protein [Pseudomonas sp. KNUC1026]UFH48428.1 hypothetical protein LN139_15025 [Pseudomonas sp. KNUC1026]